MAKLIVHLQASPSTENRTFVLVEILGSSDIAASKESIAGDQPADLSGTQWQGLAECWSSWVAALSS